jgi:NAD(P)-dependent dehydrogenase (short-subunit alcohol dehydrogenase family)
LTRILDIEPRPHGIRVNAVAPQLLDTPANRATFPAAVMAHAGQGSAGRIHIVAIRQPAGF